MDRLGYRDLSPASLRHYVMGVTVAGPLIAVVVALTADVSLDKNGLLIAAMLILLGAVGERYPLHLTHKTNINVASAAYFAMILTLPWQFPGLLALLSMIIGLQIRRRANPHLDYAETLFNTAQGALYATSGAGVYALAASVAGGGELGRLLPTVSAAVVMHVANTGLVAVAAGLQLGVLPFRVWWRNIALDLTPHVTLTVVGILAAMLALYNGYSPLLLPFLALPGYLIQRAVQETVQLRADTHEALASLVEVVELRDPYTAGHSRRVASASRLLAQQIGLTAEEADIIESAGRVHDIGKVALDPYILLKSSRLTDEEWEQMKLHPVHGANVVDRFAAYREGARFVRHHHERWDGGGYPDGIAGEEIPLGARILAIADSFDAMTSDRPYRAGMPIAKALEVLRSGAGTQWDPRLVEAFLALVAERPGEVPVFRRDETSASVASALMSGDEPPVPAKSEAA